jgi:branched-chain amino acid transport system permease protein
VGALIGTICLRFRTHFFMIVTLAFGLLLYAVFNNWDAVTRGAVGFAGIPRPRPIEIGEWRFAFGPLPHYYYLVLTAAVLVFGIQRLVVRSDFGRTLAAIRQDEKLAQTQGVDVMRYKVAVFGLGAGLAGLGGLLHVSFLRVAAPASFNLAESINAVLIVVLGGAGSLIGPALGALVFVALPEYLRMASEWRLVIFGTILILITLFAPRGLAGLLSDLIARTRGKHTP